MRTSPVGALVILILYMKGHSFPQCSPAMNRHGDNEASDKIFSHHDPFHDHVFFDRTLQEPVRMMIFALLDPTWRQQTTNASETNVYIGIHANHLHNVFNHL